MIIISTILIINKNIRIPNIGIIRLSVDISGLMNELIKNGDINPKKTTSIDKIIFIARLDFFIFKFSFLSHNYIISNFIYNSNYFTILVKN